MYLKDTFLSVGHFKSPFKTQPYKYEMNRKQLIIKSQDDRTGNYVLVPGLLLTRWVERAGFSNTLRSELEKKKCKARTTVVHGVTRELGTWPKDLAHIYDRAWINRSKVSFIFITKDIWNLKSDIKYIK